MYKTWKYYCKLIKQPLKKGKTKKKNAHKSEPGQGFNRKLIFFFLNCPGGNII